MDPVIDKVKMAALATQRYSWEQGTLAQAFLEQGDRDVVIAMAREAAYRQSDDGRAASMRGQHAVTDPCANGEALIFAWEQTGDEYFRNAYEKLLHWAAVTAPRSEEGIVYHMDYAPEIWVDSFYMLPPFLARAGKFGEAMRQIRGYWDILFRHEKKLLAHMWDDGEKRFLREDVWGVGNGWAMAGMTRVLRMLPEGYEAEKAELIEKINILLEGALRLQLENGLFYDVPDRPDTFVEVNFAQMVAYTIYRGVKGGWVSPELLPCAEIIRSTARSKVNAYGLVEGVCGAPSFDKPGTAPEGQAFFLLMEAARRDME